MKLNPTTPICALLLAPHLLHAAPPSGGSILSQEEIDRSNRLVNEFRSNPIARDVDVNQFGNEANFISEFKLAFDSEHLADNGLEFEGRIRFSEPIDEEPRGLFDKPSELDDIASEIFLSGDFGTITMGGEAGFGVSGNVNEEVGRSKEESTYGSLGVGGNYTFGIGDKGYGSVGASVTGLFFDDKISTQQDDDKNILNFGLNYRGRYYFTPDLSLSTKAYLNYGGIGSFGRGTLRQGVLNDYLTDIRTENYLNYSLTDDVKARTGILTSYFNESGNRDYDSSSITLAQEFSFNSGNPLAHPYVFGSYGCSDYRNPFTNLDSELLTLRGGLRGDLGCGVGYDISGGIQKIRYEDRFLRDATEPSFQATLFGSPIENLSIFVGAEHGIHEVFPNFGGMWMVNPVGTTLFARSFYKIDSSNGVGATLQQTFLDGENTRGRSGPEWERTSFQVHYDYKFTPQITVTPSVGVLKVDNGADSETDMFASVNVSYRF